MIEVAEADRANGYPAVNKGGTALMTPFADESWQGAVFMRTGAQMKYVSIADGRLARRVGEKELPLLDFWESSSAKK